MIYGEGDIKGTPEDLLWLVEQSGRMKEKPALYQCRGTEDFLYEDNQAFRRKCEEFGYDALTYEEGPGEHVWEYWDAHIQDVFAVVAASEIAPADRSTESLTRLIFCILIQLSCARGMLLRERLQRGQQTFEIFHERIKRVTSQ